MVLYARVFSNNMESDLSKINIKIGSKLSESSLKDNCTDLGKNLNSSLLSKSASETSP
jgi:hypothetical protein